MKSPLLCFSLIAGSFALQTGVADDRPTSIEAVRMTAYTHTESDHIKYGRKNAIGTLLRLDKDYSSAAADWSIFPLGTKFKMDGCEKTYIIDDYGSALVGKDTIDIYHPSKRAMNNWGVRYKDIEILEFGDFEKSRDILEQRKKWRHCRKMLMAINSMQSPLPPAGVPMNMPTSEPEMMLANVDPTPVTNPRPEPPKEQPKPAPAPPADPEMAPVPDPEVFLASLEKATVPEPNAPSQPTDPEPSMELASYTPPTTASMPQVGIRKVRPLSHEEVRERVVYRKRQFTPLATL